MVWESYGKMINMNTRNGWQLVNVFIMLLDNIMAQHYCCEIAEYLNMTYADGLCSMGK